MSANETIEIPDAAVVECPMIGKRLRRLKVCAACQHHFGLAERMQGPSLSFQARFLVSCGYPIGRGILIAENEAET